MANTYIGLGANQGNRLANLKKALELLNSDRDIDLISVSSFYITEPVGYKEQPYFINAVSFFKTTLGVEDFFSRLQSIEHLIGKEETFKWGPRKIDLDLLFYNELILDTPNLKIPHPLIYERLFVLIPLAELAPAFIHPQLKVSIQELIRKLDKSYYIKKISGIRVH